MHIFLIISVSFLLGSVFTQGAVLLDCQKPKKLSLLYGYGSIQCEVSQ